MDDEALLELELMDLDDNSTAYLPSYSKINSHMPQKSLSTYKLPYEEHTALADLENDLFDEYHSEDSLQSISNSNSESFTSFKSSQNASKVSKTLSNSSLQSLPSHTRPLLEISPSLTVSSYVQLQNIELYNGCDTALVFELTQRKSEMLQKRLKMNMQQPNSDISTPQTFFDDQTGEIILLSSQISKVMKIMTESRIEYGNPKSANIYMRLLNRIKEEENDAKARAADVSFHEKLKYFCRDASLRRNVRSDMQFIRKHLNSVFQLDRAQSERSNSQQTFVSNVFVRHSIGHVLIDFGAIFQRVYGSYIIAEASKKPLNVERLSQLLPLAATDVNQMARMLRELLFSRYPELASMESLSLDWKKSLEEQINECISDSICVFLSPTLYTLYACVFAQEDAFFGERSKALCENPRLVFESIFGTAVKRQDMKEYEKIYDLYEPMVALMDEAMSLTSVRRKCDALSRVCELFMDIDGDISSDIQAHYFLRDTEMRKKLAMVFLRCPSACQHAYSHIAFMASLTVYDANWERYQSAVCNLAKAIEYIASRFAFV